MDIGMLFPMGGIWRYIANRSAVIRLMVSWVGGGMRSADALYHPFICYQYYLVMGGGYEVRMA